MTETASTPGDKGSAHSAISPPLFRGLTRRRVLGGAAGSAASRSWRHAARRARRTTPRRRRSRTSPTPRRSSTGPTGRSTSTSTTRRRPTRRWTPSPSRPASRSTTPRTSTTTTSSSPRSSRSCPGGQDTGRDTFCLTDWMAARLIRLGWVQKLDKANIPNCEEPRPEPAQRRRSTRAASTRCRGRAASPASRTTRSRPAARRSRRSTSCSPTRRSRARSRCSPRCATRSAS